MSLVLRYIFGLASFFGTLYFVRFAGKPVQQFVPKDGTTEWDNLKISIVRSTPTLLFAIFLLILRNWFGWIFISATAVWISLIWDGFHLICTAYYVGKLRSLRRNPSAFFFRVKIEPYDDWPNTNLLKIFPVRFWTRGISIPTLLQPLSFLLTFLGSGTRTLRILYGDFRRFLLNDFRYIDLIDDIERKLDFSEEELWSIPHLAVKNEAAYKREIFGFLGLLGDIAKEAIEEHVGEQSDESDKKVLQDVLEAISSEENESRFSKQASRSSNGIFLINRSINSALPAELWETSCRLCETTPSIIAATWKLYHFQEDIRLRLVTLFNAADLMQRLIGAIVMRILDEVGELDSLVADPDFPCDKLGKPVYPPNSNADWNRLLSWILKRSQSPDLELFRQLLLKPNPHFTKDLDRLAPFWQMLQVRPQHPTNDENTLANFYLLNQLRNKTIGHGSVGWKLQLRPAVYLSSLHHFFLATMEEISKIDFLIFAYRESEEDVELLSIFKGLFKTEVAEGTEGRIATENPANEKFLDLHPYLRFYNGRLLMVDKFFKAEAVYIDYNAENIAEPSFIRLPTGL